ncbi:hypothetical protein F4604DRAFT_1875834 [Suillus subluteus]|nr:hypothetical protein F4604DRAFT_1875834 [Suillus subluteus]
MLDHVEGLIVTRIFELTRMNLGRNSAMSPPRKTLKWEEVVDYTFLTNFDLLHDMRVDISQAPWSSPAARSAMDLHFKICHTQEEITCLNVEVHYEDDYLWVSEEQLRLTGPALAHQISILRNIHGQFNSCHLKWLQDISRLTGFSGTLIPGATHCVTCRARRFG